MHSQTQLTDCQVVMLQTADAPSWIACGLGTHPGRNGYMQKQA